MALLQKELEESPTAERAIRSLGEAVGLSRSTIFRHLHWPSSVSSTNNDVELRGQIQSIALEMRSYGYRPITKELHRRGVKANHKRVLRLLREDNLLCLRRQAFVRTTDSNHTLTIYPNLARGLVLSNINQLWVADITYIRLRARVRLSRRDPGCLQSPLHRLGALASHRYAVGAYGLAHDFANPHRATGIDASFRSRRAICFWRLRRAFERTQNPDQHEPHRQPLR